MITFQPIDRDLQERNCRFFGVDHVNLIEFVPSQEAGIPQSSKRIFGGGNCLYRSVTFLILGIEDNHDIIRAFPLQHMLENRNIGADLFLINDMNNYVEHQRLQTWTSETEIIFVAHLLETDISIQIQQKTGKFFQENYCIQICKCLS